MVSDMIDIDVKKAILPLVLGAVMIFVGLTAGNVAGGIGQYIIGILNTSLGGAITINLFSNNIISLVSTVFTMTGVTLIVFAAAQVIAALWEATRTVTTTT